MLSRLLSALAFVVLLFSAIGPASAQLKAGAYAIDVTPEPQMFPISANGGMGDNICKRAHDPLHARCLVLDDGKMKVVLAVVDSCMIPRELLDSAKDQAEKRTGIPAKQMLISATHAHSCPTLGGVFQSEPDPVYSKYLAAKIAEGIDQANKNLTPAQIAIGAGHNDKQIFNRRWILKEPDSQSNPFGKLDKKRMNPGNNNPLVSRSTGTIDPAVHFISAKSIDGRPLAFFATYGLHYVGGVSGGELSGDYFAAFAAEMGKRLKAEPAEGKPSFVAAMHNGTSGDVNNVDFSQLKLPSYGPYERMQEVAASVAESATQAVEKAAYTKTAALAMKEIELTCKVRKPTAAEVADAKTQLEAVGSGPYGNMKDVYARETIKLADYPETVTFKLQAVRIGDSAIVTTPCETFTAIGLEIKKRSPIKNTWTISLANGYNGYLPTPEEHDAAGYETWRARSSYLEETASVKIVDALVRMLDEIKE
jgi:neutral ceramidase